MKRALFLIVVVAVLIAGGFLSMAISQQGSSVIPGLRIQTFNPEASVTAVTPQKGALFALFAMIALGSVVGMGATLAVIFWLLNRQIVRAKQSPNENFAFSLNPGTPNSVGGLVTRRPSITIAIIVILLIALSAFAAVAFNLFTAAPK